MGRSIAFTRNIGGASLEGKTHLSDAYGTSKRLYPVDSKITYSSGMKFELEIIDLGLLIIRVVILAVMLTRFPREFMP